MARGHELPNVRNGICGGEERAVEPSTSLTNELWERIGNISFADCAFDIAEDPVVNRQ